MARTNVILDDGLVAKCRRITGIRTRRSLIQHALSELLRIDKQRRLLKLEGKVAWRGDLEQWRRGRTAR
jgi:Arc/MetJ family transcription regulator